LYSITISHFAAINDTLEPRAVMLHRHITNINFMSKMEKINKRQSAFGLFKKERDS